MENNANNFGRKSEALAKQYLVNKGHQVLEANWRFKKYEVDLITQHNNSIIFVEVKARSSNAFGEPEVFVTPKKQKFLIAAAHQYLTQNDIALEARFDIIAILQQHGQSSITHLEAAFYPLLK